MKSHYDVVMIAIEGVTSGGRVDRAARSVSSAGLSLLVIGRGTNDGTQESSGRGFDVLLLPRSRAPQFDPTSPGAPAARDLALREFSLAALRAIEGLSPKLIHSFGADAIGAGAFLKESYACSGKQHVRWLHDFDRWIGDDERMPARLHEHAIAEEQRCLPLADALTAASPEVADAIRAAHGLDGAPSVITNVPRAQDFDPVPGRTVRDMVDVRADAPLGVFCGEVEATAGLDDLVAALPAIPRIQIALAPASKTEYLKDLLRRAKTSGSKDRIHVLPEVPAAGVSGFVSSATFAMFPVPPEHHGAAIPTRLFQLAHAGVPILAAEGTPSGSLVEQHRLGATYRSGDPFSLREALSRLLESQAPDGSAMRARYCWEEEELRLFDVYAPLLGVGTIATRAPVRIPDLPRGKPAGKEQPLRILHGVLGAANQPWTLARALRARGHYAHSVVTTIPKFGYRASVYAPIRLRNLGPSVAMIDDLAQQFDVFHLHARSFFWEPPDHGFPAMLDLVHLRSLGKIITFHFRGTEARLASKFAAANEFHYVGDDPYGFGRKFPEHKQLMAIDFVRSLAHAVYVTDPEIQSYVPGSVVVPRAIDIEDWEPIGAVSRDRPLVVHAPSRDKIKGTEHVLDAVESLRAEGYEFDFELVQNRSHEEARAVYERADIIIDQLRIGWHGVLAVEGMALKKPVIAYIRPDLVHNFGDDPPIAIADPSTVVDVLRDLIVDPERRERLGARARRYCEEVHASPVVAAELERRYRALVEEHATAPPSGPGISNYLLEQADLWSTLGQSRVQAGRAAKVMNVVNADLGAQVPAAKTAMRAMKGKHGSDELLGAVSRSVKRLSVVTDWLEGVAPPVAAKQPTAAVPSEASTAAAAASAPDASLREALQIDPEAIGVPLRALVGDGEPRWRTLERGFTDDEFALWADVLNGIHHAGREMLEDQRDADGLERLRGVYVAVADLLRREFYVDGNAMIAVTDEEQAALKTGVRPSIDSVRQIRLGRAFVNASLVAPEAVDVASALARAVLRPVEEGGLLRVWRRRTMFQLTGDAESDWRFDNLARFYINGAALFRILPVSERDVWMRSVQQFAALLQYYNVPDLKTTRRTLQTTIPLRFSFEGDVPAGWPDPVVVLDDDDLELRTTSVVRRDTDGAFLIEARLSGNLGRMVMQPGVRFRLHAAVGQRFVGHRPVYERDPSTAGARVARWETYADTVLEAPEVAINVTFDRSLLTMGEGLTRFVEAEGRWTNPAHSYHVEWAATLHRLYGHDAFKEAAELWAQYAEDASVPVGEPLERDVPSSEDVTAEGDIASIGYGPDDLLAQAGADAMRGGDFELDYGVGELQLDELLGADVLPPESSTNDRGGGQTDDLDGVVDAQDDAGERVEAPPAEGDDAEILADEHVGGGADPAIPDAADEESDVDVVGESETASDEHQGVAADPASD